MKKRVLLVSLALVLCLCACGKKKTDSPETSAEVSVSDSTESSTVSTEVSAEEIKTSTDALDEEPEIFKIAYDIQSASDKLFDEELNTNTVSYSCSTIEITEDGYDALKTAISAYSDEVNKASWDNINRSVDILSELIEGGDTYIIEQLPLESDYTLAVVRNDEQIFTVLLDIYGWTGGAHPYTENYFTNFNSKTGEKLAFSDVISDVDAFCDKVTAKVSEMTIKDEGIYEDYEDVIYTYFHGETLDNVNWVLTEDKICIRFQEYQIAPYVLGMIDVNIPLEELGDILNSEYCK